MVKSEIQNLFDLGMLKHAEIHASAENNYTLTFYTKNGEPLKMTEARGKNVIRDFKTIDAAVRTVEKMGFKFSAVTLKP